MTEVQQPYSNTNEEQAPYLDGPNNHLVGRVLSYPVVNYVSGTVKNCYSYAKESNSYVKAGLETAENISQPLLTKIEEYSHQPTIESLLHKVDQFGCNQLDKIESGGKQIKETYEVIKPKTYQGLENVATKIHGTTVETVLFKTVDAVDVVVDSLLPADPAESEEETETTEDPNIIDKTSPVIRKLKKRVSKDSVKHLPSQTYSVTKDIIFRNADANPHLHYCIGVLSTAALKVHNVSAKTEAVARNGMHKGAELSKTSVDYVYTSLHSMVNALTSLVVLMKKMDPIEGKATVAELTTMIQHSKTEFYNKYGDLSTYGKEKATRLKEDISKILQKSGDILSHQVAAGYERAHTTDITAIRKSVETIESIASRIVDSFSGSQTQPEQQEQTQPNQPQE